MFLNVLDGERRNHTPYQFNLSHLKSRYLRSELLRLV